MVIDPFVADSSDRELNRCDFVVLKRELRGVERRAVGIVQSIHGGRYRVFFVGVVRTVLCARDDIDWIDVTKTGKPHGPGDPYPYKICNICHVLKRQNSEFQSNQIDSRGRITTRPSCNHCRIDIEGHRITTGERNRMNDIRPRSHSLFICPICNKQTIVDITVKLAMDHDAHTGRGREWICDSCNTGIGRFRDDVVFLERVIAYLQRARDT